MYLGSRLRGKILSIKIVAGAVTASWVLTVTGETTEMPILYDDDLGASATTWRHPRSAANQVADGAAITDSALDIPILNERIKCVVSAAGTSADVTITVFYDSEL